MGQTSVDMARMIFREKLNFVTRPNGVGLCIGLDPDPDRLPSGFPPDPDGISEFIREVISASAPYASAYKVNTAFYEAWGSEGWALLESIARALPEAAMRIADAKRGDIGNTARRYAQAFFERMPFDAVTLNPYLGGDALIPFLENPPKGAYLLVLTTNPGSKDLQYFSDGKDTLYQRILSKIPSWSQHGNLGAVVGATHADELYDIRRRFPTTPLLIPGIGAQGGDAEAIARTAGGKGLGPLLVNVSRSILYPDNDLEFPQSIVRACQDFRHLLGIADNTS